ncbi:MAG: nucleotidyltransferase [Gammaproteobacteria bacterium]|nr:nucleotidyltransferase [Gammaproteobacteria bacterium]
MAKFSEITLSDWSRAASASEEQRISNAISMIKEAVNNSDQLKEKEIEIFVQGSYANNTNVRANSDIDICIMLKDTFSAKYPKGLTRGDYGFSASDYSFSTFRSAVIKSLADKFGNENITPGNKSIKINSNSYRIEADAVPCFQYRNYYHNDSKNPNDFIEGHKIYAQNDDDAISYPKQHIENGKNKNVSTQRRFKRTTRVLKKIRYHMIDNGESVDRSISSFLIECLLWNVPDDIFNENDTHESRVKESIRYLYFKTKDHQDECKKWGEVSEILFLFSDNKKWNIDAVNQFLGQMWNYLEFSD